MNKRTLLTAASLGIFGFAQAQHWAPLGQPQKLEHIIRQYGPTFKAKEQPPIHSLEMSKSGKFKPEGKNYHYKRWLWYWKEHLDDQGYMVSPMQNFLEAQRVKYVQTAAKTTALPNLSQWSFSGPVSSPGGYNGIGRINVVAFHPTDVNTFIIGSAGGGCWRTTTSGASWTALYNDLPVLGVSDVDYNPLNPSTIFVCTGDRDASDTYSVGILKSTDNGTTWNVTGLQFAVTDFVLTNALVINPLDTNSLTVATSNGIYKSYNNGQTFTQVQTGHFKSVLYHPTDTNILYAGRYGDAQIFRSADGGASWTQVTGFNNCRRVEMAICPAAPSLVKAVVSNSQNGLDAIYNSTDDGQNFYPIYGYNSDCSQNILSGSLTPDPSSCGGQGWYDLCIAIHPGNPDQVVVGGVNTWYSNNGGGSFTIATQWYSGLPGVKTVHADKHYFAYNPLEPGVLYECNDGGIYKSQQPNSFLWSDLTNGLGITQFYRNAVTDAADFIIGGAQDNGTKMVSFSGVEDELTGGDGMDCQIDFASPQTFYTSSQFGKFNRTTNGGLTFQNINNIPGDPDGDWITPLIIHPWNSTTIIAGYNKVWASYDQGDSWIDISSGINTTTNMRRLSMSLSDDNTIYGLWGDNTIRKTSNFGSVWSVIGFPYGSVNVSDILADPKDKDRLWVTISGYSSNKVATYKPGSGGNGWTTLNTGIPNVPVRCIAIDSSNNTKYVGTDIGVWYRDTSMTDWAPYNNGLPTAEITDLGINYATNELWAATYGRGFWKSPRQRDTTGNIVSVPYVIGPLQPGSVTISPNPNQGRFTLSTSKELLKGQSIQLKILSFTGQIVYQQPHVFSSDGKISLQLPTTPARGAYIVQVLREDQLVGHAQMVIW